MDDLGKVFCHKLKFGMEIENNASSKTRQRTYTKNQQQVESILIAIQSLEMELANNLRKQANFWAIDACE